MQSSLIIRALKTVLSEKKIRYVDVATGLGISVSSVKRLFSNEDMSLNRVEKICELAKIDLFELLHLAENGRKTLHQLSHDQEQKLCDKPRLLLVCICLGADLSFDEIAARHHIDLPDLTQHFIELDEIGIIDLLPNNLYRLKVSKHFSWIPNGPINHFFINSVAAKYIGRSLYGPKNHFYLKWGIITPASAQIILGKIERLIEEYVLTESAEARIPASVKDTSSLLVFFQENWQHEDFDLLWE